MMVAVKRVSTALWETAGNFRETILVSQNALKNTGQASWNDYKKRFRSRQAFEFDHKPAHRLWDGAMPGGQRLMLNMKSAASVVLNSPHRINTEHRTTADWALPSCNMKDGIVSKMEVCFVSGTGAYRNNRH